MNNSRDKIQNLINEHITNLFNEFSDLTNGISDRKIVLKDLDSEYLIMSQALKEVSEQKLDFEGFIKQKTQNLDKRQEEIDRVLGNIEEERSNKKKELEELIGYISVKGGELKEIEKKVKQIKPLEKVKIKLDEQIKELYSTKNEIEKGNHISLKEKTDKSAELTKEIVIKRNELIKVEKALGEEVSKKLPTIQEMDQREQELDEREHALDIIQNRYERLYGEEGFGFKV